MAVILPIHGLFFLVFCLLTFRWLDTKTLRLLCIWALAFELISANMTNSALSAANMKIVWPVCDSLIGFSSVKLPVILTFDAVSSLFISILIIALILCFAFLSEYFEYDVYGPTIIFLSSLFSQLAVVFFMTADVFSMLVFWELISIVSFFLIRFWSMRVTTLKAGLKVFMISQLGDVFFILGCCLAINLCGSSDIAVINASMPNFLWYFLVFGHMHISIPQLFSMAFLAALFLKSAQFVFYP